MRRDQENQHDGMTRQHQLVFRFRLGFVFWLDRTRLLQGALDVFLFLDLFDFSAQFVRHSYRILTSVLI